MTEENNEMTEEQAESILRDIQEQKQNQHTFLTKVIQSKDTTKTGNLTQEELGSPRVPLRTFKQLELFCRDIYCDEDWANYYQQLAEIHTSSSLSKDAKLLNLSVTSKKELADMTPKEKKENKGWFRKRE